MNTKAYIFFIFIMAFTVVLSCDEDNDINTFDTAGLVGTWHIIGIHDSSPQGPTTLAPDGEIIEINFTNDGTLGGTTPGNTFGGSYKISNEKLSITELVTTETADTAYGQLFYKSLNDSRDDTTRGSIFQIEKIENNNLQLNYTTGKYLLLEKQ